VSLRGKPVERIVELPDGRTGVVRVAVADDPYIPSRQLDTVALELVLDDRVAATVNTVLDVEQSDEAAELAREVADGLASGALKPTAGALEPLAATLR
jgi:hypothetical protein